MRKRIVVELCFKTPNIGVYEIKVLVDEDPMYIFLVKALDGLVAGGFLGTCCSTGSNMFYLSFDALDPISIYLCEF